MGDVIGWSKIGKLKKVFDDWKADWTTARAQKIDTIMEKVNNVYLSVPNGTDATAKESTARDIKISTDQIKSTVNKGLVKYSETGSEIGFARDLSNGGKNIMFAHSVDMDSCVVDINMECWPLNGEITSSQKGLMLWELHNAMLTIKCPESFDMSHDGMYAVSWKITEFY